MTEELKDLIEKIQHDGVVVAQEKAKAMESQARQQAGIIVAKAKSEAEKMLLDAEERIAKMQKASGLELKQAGRDALIALKKEIGAALERILKSSVGQALSAQELAKIISALIQDYSHNRSESIEIAVKKEDLDAIEKSLFGLLKEEVKKGVTLRASDEVSAGFLISFDNGKSHFDFTDKALSDYLSTYFKPKLQEILSKS